MAKVQIADVIVMAPLMVPYSVQVSTQSTALWDSGIISNDAELDAASNGTAMTVRMPFWNDLTGTSEGLSDSTALTPDKLGTGQDIAVKHYRGKAWAVNELVKYFAGDDPVTHIYDRIGAWWGRDMQTTILLPSLAGLFGANGALSVSHQKDVTLQTAGTATDANQIGSDAIIDAAGLLGDQWAQVVALAMHSTIFRRLQKLGLIDFVSLKDQNTQVGFFLGRRVIEDDGLVPVVAAANGVPAKYPVYLFGNGAIGIGNSTIPVDEALEADRDSLAGDDIIISRRHFIMHPRGVKWIGTYSGQTPSPTDLSNPANWQKAWDDKNIRVLRLLVNA